MTSKLIPNELYTATITFKSLGGSNFVQPEFSYSHEFSEEYLNEGNELPASYIALRDVGLMLRMMANQNIEKLQNISDEELLALSPDERVKAIEEAASNAKGIARLEKE
jgi:hypothetical protein